MNVGISAQKIERIALPLSEELKMLKESISVKVARNVRQGYQWADRCVEILCQDRCNAVL